MKIKTKYFVQTLTVILPVVVAKRLYLWWRPAPCWLGWRSIRIDASYLSGNLKRGRECLILNNIKMVLKWFRQKWFESSFWKRGKARRQAFTLKGGHQKVMTQIEGTFSSQIHFLFFLICFPCKSLHFLFTRPLTQN